MLAEHTRRRASMFLICPIARRHPTRSQFASQSTRRPAPPPAPSYGLDLQPAQDHAHVTGAITPFPSMPRLPIASTATFTMASTISTSRATAQVRQQSRHDRYRRGFRRDFRRVDPLPRLSFPAVHRHAHAHTPVGPLPYGVLGRRPASTHNATPRSHDSYPDRHLAPRSPNLRHQIDRTGQAAG